MIVAMIFMRAPTRPCLRQISRRAARRPPRFVAAAKGPICNRPSLAAPTFEGWFEPPWRLKYQSVSIGGGNRVESRRRCKLTSWLPRSNQINIGRRDAEPVTGLSCDHAGDVRFQITKSTVRPASVCVSISYELARASHCDGSFEGPDGGGISGKRVFLPKVLVAPFRSKK